MFITGASEGSRDLLKMMFFLLFAGTVYGATIVDPKNNLTVQSSRAGLEQSEDDTDVQRIVGGNIADRGEYPWLIVLRYNNIFRCGGSIIDAETILTAAHCVINDPRQRFGDFSIKAGDYRTFKKERTEQIRRVKRVILHPGYNDDTFDKDAAILKLASPLKFNNYVKKIRIAGKIQEQNLLSSPVCTVSGIGDSDGAGKTPSRTLEASARMKSRRACRNIANNDYFRMFTKHMICSLDYLKGVCSGDSGGPLTCYDNNDNPFLVGVVSWGSTDCWEGYNVYARVSYVKTWINNYLTE